MGSLNESTGTVTDYFRRIMPQFMGQDVQRVFTSGRKSWVFTFLTNHQAPLTSPIKNVWRLLKQRIYHRNSLLGPVRTLYMQFRRNGTH